MPLLIFAFFRDPKPNVPLGLGDLWEVDLTVRPSHFLILGDVIVSASSFGRHGTLMMKKPQVISAQAQNSNGPIKYI